MGFSIGFLFFLAVIVFISAVKVTQEYERGVVFRLGRLAGVRGPGLIIIIPFIEKFVRIDLRTVTMDLPVQEVITKDNVTIKVNAVVYFQVMRPDWAITKVFDFSMATLQIAQTTLRNVLGQSTMDEVLSERAEINLRLQQIIDDQTEPWGIKVSLVEIKDLELPQSMQRAMARQAEAERERRAKIIHAEGERQAAEQLRMAADTMASEPVTLQLRYLQTLVEVSAEKNSTIIFPIPINIMEGLAGVLDRFSKKEA